MENSRYLQFLGNKFQIFIDDFLLDIVRRDDWQRLGKYDTFPSNILEVSFRTRVLRDIGSSKELLTNPWPQRKPPKRLQLNFISLVELLYSV